MVKGDKLQTGVILMQVLKLFIFQILSTYLFTTNGNCFVFLATFQFFWRPQQRFATPTLNTRTVQHKSNFYTDHVSGLILRDLILLVFPTMNQ